MHNCHDRAGSRSVPIPRVGSGSGSRPVRIRIAGNTACRCPGGSGSRSGGPDPGPGGSGSGSVPGPDRGSDPAGRFGRGESRKMILCIAMVNEGLQARILLAPQRCGSATHVSPTGTGLPCHSKYPRYRVLVVPRMQGGNDAACRSRCCSTYKFELPKS